jgi:hypothetical protein
VGCLPHADFGGSLRRHHRWDVFRPDPASLSHRVRRIGAGSASGINSASPGPDARRRKPCRGANSLKGATANDEPTLLGFGGNAWNAEATALTLHALFPHRNVVAFHYRGYAPSTGGPSARALFSDSLTIVAHLLQTHAGERILPVGFSIGALVAAYLARHRPVAGLIPVTPFDSLEAVARDLYWWAPVGPLLRNRMPTIEFVRGSNVPTALITAEHDAIAPKRRPLRAAIRNLVFERSVDAGHNDLYDHPDFTAAAEEALTRVEAASSENPEDRKRRARTGRPRAADGRLGAGAPRFDRLALGRPRHRLGAALDLALLNLIVWEKSNGGQGGLWRSQHELLPGLKKGEAPHINNVELGRHHPDITASRRERQFRENGGKRLSKNGGTLERAAQVAEHPSTPKTQLCDRR